MKQMPLILAALIFASAAGAQTRPDVIVQIHFAGAEQISADTNRLACTNLFNSAEARALASQTLDRLSRVPGAWIKSKLPPGAGDGAAQLRPLLDDFLKSEWIMEIRDATNGSPEYALAIRLSPARAQLWSNNLAALLQNWTGIGIARDKSGNWELKKHEAPNLFRWSQASGWVVIGCGQNELPLSRELLQSYSAFGLSKKQESWLNVDANWPRLAQLFPALAELDLPKISMQVFGRGGTLALPGKLALAQPLPAPGKWRVPAGVIRQPFDSFTAARGIAPWLQKQDWVRPFLFQPPPDQVFIWAVPPIPFQTFAAVPVPDANAGLTQLYQRLSTDTSWQGHLMNPLTVTMTNGEITWSSVPFLSPFVKAVQDPAGDFLVGGLFPNPPRSQPLPAELLAHLNQPDLVYYHWEVTSQRLSEMPQMSQLLLLLTMHEQLDGQSAAAKWLDLIGPALGSSVTEVTQTAPNELAFKRTASAGLTAIELRAFADWLEAPKFSAFDLRLPPPRIRPGQGSFNVPAVPPAAPAPPHP
jgi:hypothetical protein